MERREPSNTAGGNVHQYGYYGAILETMEPYGDSLKTKNRTPYDLAIPLLGLYPEKNMI